MNIKTNIKTPPPCYTPSSRHDDLNFVAFHHLPSCSTILASPRGDGETMQTSSAETVSSVDIMPHAARRKMSATATDFGPTQVDASDSFGWGYHTIAHIRRSRCYTSKQFEQMPWSDRTYVQARTPIWICRMTDDCDHLRWMITCHRGVRLTLIDVDCAVRPLGVDECRMMKRSESNIPASTIFSSLHTINIMYMVERSGRNPHCFSRSSWSHIWTLSLGDL